MKQTSWIAAWGVLALHFAAAPVAALSLEMRWDPGADPCDAGSSRTESHAIDEFTLVIRQNPCVDYEANFMYLLMGTRQALLIDSGASADPRHTAELIAVVSRHLEAAGRRLPLVVAHTHGHQDHRAGDAAFAARSDTTVVPHDGEGMRKFFGLEDWPNGSAPFDLGERLVEVVPTPGHHEDHVVFMDARTRLVFSGDFLLPGRLLVQDIDAYRDSALRMTEAVAAHGATHALGAHVEMDVDGRLFPSGATSHPDERQVALPFTGREASALRQALVDFNGFYDAKPDYVIVNPLRNLMALGLGIAVALGLVVWALRRARRRFLARRSTR